MTGTDIRPGPDGYHIVTGVRTTTRTATSHGANPGPSEAAVLVPNTVIEAYVQQRTAELEAARDRAARIATRLEEQRDDANRRITECRSEIKDLYAQLAELQAEREKHAGRAQKYQDQRDGALSTMGRFGNALAKIAEFKLTEHPNDQGWLIVADDARQLRAIAGRPRPRDADPAPDGT